MKKGLEGFISPRHLKPQNRERLYGLSEKELTEGVFLESFLHTDLIERLNQLLCHEAEYESGYLSYEENAKGDISVAPVSEDKFHNLSEKMQFLFRRRFIGVKPEFRMSPNWLSYLKLVNFYQNELPDYLSPIVGCRLSLQSLQINADQNKHFIKKHSDYTAGRKLCTILYLTPDWKPEYGGALLMHQKDDSVNRIDALCNRLALFLPKPRSPHSVEAFTELGKDMTRSCLVAWFDGED